MRFIDGSNNKVVIEFEDTDSPLIRKYVKAHLEVIKTSLQVIIELGKRKELL